MTPFRALPLVLAAVATLALAGCESSEARAERHFRSALALIAAGDTDRAAIELRNVFRLNGTHKEAREIYAGLLYDRGDVTGAYSQYLRLIEQYPDTLPVRVRLAGIAIGRSDWAEAERHGRAAQALDPALPAVQAIATVLDYRDAVLARDAGRRAQAAAQAAILVDAGGDLGAAAGPLRRILVDFAVSADDTAGALAAVDAALAAEPEAFDLHVMRLRLLGRTGDVAAIGVQLRDMVARFPDNTEARGALVQWYVARGDLAGAEAFLRETAGAPDGAPEGHVTVVEFIRATRGNAEAQAELARLTAAAGAHPNADLFRVLSASIDFDEGRQAAAIAAVEAVLAGAAPSDQTRRIKVTLARMLQATRNPVGARARIEEVLAEDPSQVDALKLRAELAIAADRPSDAIADLRAALNQAPRDPEVMTLMAQAHERNGARELAGEMLALAVETSNRAPAETLRYARFLVAENRRASAVTVVGDALRANPNNPELLAALADLHLGGQDWARAREAAAALRALGQPEAAAVAGRIEAAAMLGENRTAEGIAAIEGLVASGQADLASAAGTVVQTRLREGNPAAARAYLDGVIAENPGDPRLRLLDASLSTAIGEPDRAETVLRALIAEFPDAEPPYRLLYGLLAGQGKAAAAAAVLEAALARQPASATFLSLQAEALQRAGDIEGAIAVYERLYAQDSANPVIANNLASLITTFRTDAESLERGHAIARRLRGSPVPAFADTYGWIEFRRGNLDEAIAHLEPAARGLPDDPLVQYHLGMAYAAAGRRDEAVAQLTRALALAGDSPLPQFVEARARLAELQGN